MPIMRDVKWMWTASLGIGCLLVLIWYPASWGQTDSPPGYPSGYSSTHSWTQPGIPWNQSSTYPWGQGVTNPQEAINPRSEGGVRLGPLNVHAGVAVIETYFRSGKGR